MSRYHEARELAVRGLEHALMAHEQADWFSIEDGLEQYDMLIPREELPANSLLFLTLEFWSAWADSAVHTWEFYPPLQEADWPRLARILLNNLKADTEVTDEEIIKHFSVFPSESVLAKLYRFFKGKKSNKRVYPTHKS